MLSAISKTITKKLKNSNRFLDAACQKSWTNTVRTVRKATQKCK
jgi:hypothetical protein